MEQLKVRYLMEYKIREYCTIHEIKTRKIYKIKMIQEKRSLCDIYKRLHANQFVIQTDCERIKKGEMYNIISMGGFLCRTRSEVRMNEIR